MSSTFFENFMLTMILQTFWELHQYGNLLG